MKRKVNKPKPIMFIRKRCAHLSEDELLEAEERFREYVKICIEIYEDLKDEEESKEVNN